MSQNVNRSKNENSNEQNEGLFPHRGKMRLVEHGSPTSESLSQGCPSCENAEDTYSYDDIGNLQLSSFNAATNAYTANGLNQYTSILCDSVTLCEPTYDTDGNMLSDGVLSFTYDAASRLKTVSSNGVTLVTNFYDAKSRRVKKVTANATTTFFYDGWNLVEERIAYADNTTSTIRYYWGKDLSCTLQKAGGVGGSARGQPPASHFRTTLTLRNMCLLGLRVSGLPLAVFTLRRTTSSVTW